MTYDGTDKSLQGTNLLNIYWTGEPSGAHVAAKAPWIHFVSLQECHKDFWTSLSLHVLPH